MVRWAAYSAPRPASWIRVKNEEGVGGKEGIVSEKWRKGRDGEGGEGMWKFESAVAKSFVRNIQQRQSTER